MSTGNAEAWTQRYRGMLGRYGETIQLRHFSGVGAEREYVDYAVLARPSSAAAIEIAGAIQEHSREVIVLADDLRNAGLAFPVTNSDAVVIGGKVHQITEVDDWTCRVNGVVVALKLKVRG